MSAVSVTKTVTIICEDAVSDSIEVEEDSGIVIFTCESSSQRVTVNATPEDAAKFGQLLIDAFGGAT